MNPLNCCTVSIAGQTSSYNLDPLRRCDGVEPRHGFAGFVVFGVDLRCLLPVRSAFVCLVLVLAPIVSAQPARCDDTLGSAPSEAVATAMAPADDLRTAIERSLALLEVASAAKSAEQRKCFTCHSQAHPVIVLSEARRRGFRIDGENLDRQLRHTAKHLDRGRNDYIEGRGQGGKADTAGYALWTLSTGEHKSRSTTDPVIAWLLQQQEETGQWKRSSDRPPSEASHFTTTYLTLRALRDDCDEPQQIEVTKRYDRARTWLAKSTAADTEDRVFRLLALQLVEASENLVHAAADELLKSQNSDGGWSQRDSMDSDAYATGTALYALAQTHQLRAEQQAYQSGVRYLLETQYDDGSWHVVSRSDPFQAYYETGFPHGPDQFISTSATAWATFALLLAYRED